jgi:predicted amidophosphoribosyltransferase
VKCPGCNNFIRKDEIYCKDCMKKVLATQGKGDKHESI